MPEHLHPGVYVYEKSSGNKPIEAASTSTACFIGTARRGRPFHPVFVTSWAQFERAFGGLDRRSDLGLAVRSFFLNGGSRAYVVRLLAPPANPGEGVATVKIDVGGGQAEVRAKGRGEWGNVRLQILLNRHSGAVNDATVARFDWVIEAKSPDGVYEPVESHFDLGVREDGDRFYAAVVNRSSEYIEVVPQADGNHLEGPIQKVAADKPLQVDLAGGSDGVGDPLTSKSFEEAFAALKQVDDISLLVTPGVGMNDKTWQLAATVASVAEERKLFYVLDGPGDPRNTVPADKQIENVQKLLAGFSPKSSYVGLYFPWLEIPDPFSKVSGATRYAAPSGFVAGLIARTDNTRGVWKAPAGTEAMILGAVDTAVKISDADQDALNPVGINCIRKFPAAGIVSWGTRTLATRRDPEYRYIPVRRFARFLAQSIERGTQWVVFEPNDEPLWSAIRFNLGAFMQRMYREGALQGGKPEEAFFVKCDRDNNTQDRIDAGEVHVTVGFAPLKPAEFVIIDIVQMRRQ